MIPQLLAQASPRQRVAIESMRSHFEETDPQLYWKISFVALLFVIGALLVALLGYLERRRQRRENKPQPIRLYLWCLAKLQVPWPDILRLWRLARALRLSHPTALLISPRLYDAAVTKYWAGHWRGKRGGEPPLRFMAIRELLFTDVP